jgi:hypothetical protein
MNIVIWACARAAGGNAISAGGKPEAPGAMALSSGGIGANGPGAGTDNPGPIGLGMGPFADTFDGVFPEVAFVGGIGGGVLTDTAVLPPPDTSAGIGILTSVKSSPSRSSSSSPSLSFSRKAWDVLSSAFL